MSERRGITRRTLVGAAGAAPLAAQHGGHQSPVRKEEKQQPFLSSHELATLRVLCDRILPADETSPAASAAGAVEYIDLLCRGNVRIARTYHGGLAWLDSESSRLHGAAFLDVPEAGQNEILEKLAYREKTPPEWKAGAVFFDWVRKMTVDAFYTSPVGYRDLGYVGGKGMTTYLVPEAVLRQALERSKL